MSTRWRPKLACSCVHNATRIVRHTKITVFCTVSPDNLIVTDVSELRVNSIFTVALWWALCNEFTYSCVFVLAWFLQRIKLLGSVVSLPYKAQQSLYVPHSGHYIYRTVVTVCTAQRAPYVQHSGHYMYRTVVTIYTAQRSPYVPHNGHHMYRRAVTICTAQWSLYISHSGHHMYRKTVTICTARWSLYVPPV